MQYSEIIGVDKYFKDAFDIKTDVGDSWKTFITNDKFENNLNQIVNVFTTPDHNKRKSIWIQGTYGTGKSHSLAVIKHLLCDDYSKIEDYIPKISRLQAKSSISSFRQSKRVYPVVMKGIYAITDVADLTYTIQQEVANTLEKDGIKISTKTDFETVQQILENGKLDAFFNDLVERNIELRSYASNKEQLISSMKKHEIKVLRIIEDELKEAGVGGYRTHDIVAWLKDVKDELVNRNIADYLLIFWDEFTSLLDIPARRSILNVMQDIAELSWTETEDKTDTVGVYVLMVTHKKLEATESYKDLKEDERTMAKARFMELDYGMQPTTTYHILSGALIRKDEAKLNELIAVNFTGVPSVNTVTEKIVDATLINAGEVKSKITSLYPFHPYTSYLATFVSRVVGEAERSIFGFLNDQEFGFKRFLENNIEDTKFLTADYVWDFFFKTFEANLVGHFDTITNKYKLCKEAVLKRGAQYNEVFKVILLLNILYRVTTTDADVSEKSMVNPSEENVKAAFSGTYTEDVMDEILNYLDDAQILHKSPDGIFEIASSSLPQKRLLEEKRKLYSSKEDVSKVIEDYQVSCLKQLNKTITNNIPREKEVRVFWGGEKEHTLKNKINAKFKSDFAIHVALFVYRGETKELDNLLGRNEISISESKNMLLQISKEAEFKNIVFIPINTVLGNRKFESYMDSIAQETVARSLNMEEERREGANNAEKWIKQWIAEIITSGYADLIFRGDSIHVPFSQCNKHIKDEYVKTIFRYGLDYLETLTSWKHQNSKSAVEVALYSTCKTELEKSSGQDANAVKSMLVNETDMLFDEQLCLVSSDSNNPIVKLCQEVEQKIEELKNEPSINLGKEFEYLKKPEYGYYQNRLFMGAMALAFRPYIGKLYKSGNGQKIDKTVMKDIIVAMFDYWENDKFRDELVVRMSTEEERILTEELNKVFRIFDKDGLIETKWAIRDKFKNKSKAPLWALKYLGKKNSEYADFIEKLFKFSKSTDENIQQNFIIELLNGIKTFNIELSIAIVSVESERCLEIYIASELKEIGEDEKAIEDVKVYLQGVMSGDIAFWEERDMHENILKWKIDKDKAIKPKEEDLDTSSQDDNGDATSGSNINHATDNNDESGDNKLDFRKKVIQKLEFNKENTELLYKVISGLIEKYSIILEDIDDLL